MPSSLKTTLGLNQWMGGDKPKRDDFNTDNLLINQLLSEHKTMISNTEPIESCGIWLRPMGVISVSDLTDDEAKVQINLSGVHVGSDPPSNKNMLWVKPILEI